jgi:endonuclease G, mitochondrial
VRVFCLSTIVFVCLIFSSEAQEKALLKHPEIPAVSMNDAVITHAGFSLLYSEPHEQAKWVAYDLTREETWKTVKRTDRFLPDPLVKTGTATDADYRGSGYDRGHMAPAADMGWSAKAMAESFYYSNMSPQVPACNRGVWKRLEEKVRSWAAEYGALYIVTGPVLSDTLPFIGPDKVSVPYYYYKVIVDHSSPDMKGIGFIVPNEGSDELLSHFAVSIDSVETLTGIDFFPSLPNEEAVEAEVCIRCWDW